MALLTFLLPILVTTQGRAAYVVSSTHAPIAAAIELCDTETQAAASGRYAYFKLATVIGTLTQIRDLADSTRVWQTRTAALAQLASLDRSIDAEVAEAQSGRWSYYTLTTTARLMQGLKTQLQAIEKSAE